VNRSDENRERKPAKSTNGKAPESSAKTSPNMGNFVIICSLTPISPYFPINYPNGQVVQYGYYPTSADERLQTITNLAPGTSGTISQFSYGYNAAGDITSWVRQTGANASSYQYGYDAADQLLTATPAGSGSGAAVDAYGYWYDPAGNRTVEQIANAVTTSLYNSLNQMASRSGGGLLTITGTLDRPGTVTVSGTTYLTKGSDNFFWALAPVVTGSNNIAISATNVNGYGVTKTLGVNVTGGTAIPSLTYDLNGNLTNDSTNTYGWDAANRLTAVDYPGGAYSTFAYDGQGRRVQIIETGSGGSVTSTKNLIWEGMNISEEKNTSGAVTKRYFAQGVQIGGTNYYYTRDHLGSIRAMTTGTSGTVVAEYDYDPYGRQTQLSGTMSADFGFTGLYVHQPSGLNLAAYREYSAALGRWISRDPSGEKSGINLYDYVGNRPIILSDPNGLDPSQWNFGLSTDSGSLGHPDVTFKMNATQKQCCEKAIIYRYIPLGESSDRVPNGTPEGDGWQVDDSDGSGGSGGWWDGTLAHSAGDEPHWGYPMIHFPFDVRFRFDVRCTDGKPACRGKTLDTAYKTWHSNGGVSGGYSGYWK
jgi:RHS repeat-associated protein